MLRTPTAATPSLVDEISIPFLHAPAPCSDVPLASKAASVSDRMVGLGVLAAWAQDIGGDLVALLQRPHE